MLKSVQQFCKEYHKLLLIVILFLFYLAIQTSFAFLSNLALRAEKLILPMVFQSELGDVVIHRESCNFCVFLTQSQVL